MNRARSWLIAPFIFIGVLIGGCTMGPALATFVTGTINQRAPWILWAVGALVGIVVLSAVVTFVVGLIDYSRRW